MNELSSRPVAVQEHNPAADPPAATRLLPLVAALRPRQWIKNGLVFLPFIFSINERWQPLEAASWLELLPRLVAAFVAFCAVASAEYLVNDLRDIERDRLHPKKRRRSIAAGLVRPRVAALTAALLAVAGVAAGAGLGGRFLLALGAYAALSLAYTYWLKHVVIMDVLAPAVGFVIRTVGGALAIDVPVSPWLYSMTMLGALFVFIYKRRSELTLLDAGAGAHRPILAEYTAGLLDQMAAVVTASTLIAYSLYTFTAANLPTNHSMMLTIPFVLYGIFRYMYLVHRHDEGGSPEEVLTRDRPLLLAAMLWLVVSAVILYLGR